MDLYEAYPEMRSLEHEDLKEKSLRLIGLNGLARDDTHYFFEFSQAKSWGTLNGTKVIGLGTARLTPKGEKPVHIALVNYIRRTWRCDVRVETGNSMIVMNADRELSTLDMAEGTYPFIAMLTAPRLGGSVMPDALVQIVYRMQITRPRSSHKTNLVRVEREHLLELLGQEMWNLSELKALSWADVRIQEPVPMDAKVRPVLGLRALKPILDADLYTV